MTKQFTDGLKAAARLLTETAEGYEQSFPRLEIEAARARNGQLLGWLRLQQELTMYKEKARLLRGQATIILTLRPVK
jgi:hypothetical protein